MSDTTHAHSLSGTFYRAGCRGCRALNKARSRHYRAASPEHAEANRRMRRASYARHKATQATLTSKESV